MIQFNFTSDPYPSVEDQQKSIASFLDKLGSLKEEFETKGGYVVFNNPQLDTNNLGYEFGFNDKQHNIGEFIEKWNILIEEEHTRHQ